MLLAALALPGFARADARETLERRLGPQGVVDIDPATGTPRVVARLDGTLTGPAEGAAATIGLRYVRENRAALGLTAADLETLGDPTVKAAGGVRAVRWRQEVDGIETADTELRVNVTDDGRVLNVLGSPSSDLPSDTTPRLSKPEPDAELTIFADRLAYRYLDEAAPDEIYDVISDADTGKVLKRTNLVKSATGRVWENYPGAGAALGGTAVDTVFPATWLTPADKLESPWVHAYVDSSNDNTANQADEVVPQPLGFTSFANGFGCETAKLCSWNGSPASKATNRDQNAIQAYYLANRFRDHLAAAPISFDEFEGTDKVRLETSDGNGTNNANMYTPPEGKPPRMQMFFWGDPYRSINSGDDASTLFHEYTHGLTGRLVVDADGIGALGSWQAGAMGEGWSDWYAKDFLVAQLPGLDNAGVDGDVDMGTYVDVEAHGPGADTMRTEALDCPVGVINPQCPNGGYTYDDFAQIAGGAEFHADGEIWAQTLWDLRKTIDSTAARRLITAALRLSPPEPSFLDMRNAILQADAAAVPARQFHDDIWTVFAARGMGYYASATGGVDIAPIENFAMPPGAATPRGTLSGTVTSDGAPLEGVAVSIGGQSAGPEALTATTGADGRYTIPDVPVQNDAAVVVRGTSNAQLASGYEQEIVAGVDIAENATTTVNATLRRNWTSVRAGASVQSTAGNENADNGCGLQHAVDGLPSSTWSTAIGGAPKALVVKLPQSVDVSAVGADPGAGCGDDEDSATRNYTIELSADGTTWQAARSGTFTAADNHRMNRFTLATVARGMQYARITPTNTQGGAGYIDLSEFAVYGTPAFGATITSGPTGPVETATFAFTGTGTTSFECSLDGAAFTACTSPKSYTGLSEGPHHFEVRGVNGAQRTAVAARDFTINRTLPTTRLDSTPPARSASATVAFGFSGSGSRFECSWDAAAFAPCASGESRTLGDGPHTFSVRAVNNMGPDPSPESYAFTVDATAPETAFTWAPPAILTTRDFSFAFTASEAATFICSVDGAAAQSCTSPLALTGLAEGAHSVVVTAIDAAGHADPTPARSDFTVIIPGLPPAPSPTPTPTVTPPPKAAITTVTVAKTASLKTLRRTGKLTVKVRGTTGAKVALQAKVGTRVLGTTTKTLGGSTLTIQLVLNKQRVRAAKAGTTVTLRVTGTGSGLRASAQNLKIRLKA